MGQQNARWMLEPLRQARSPGGHSHSGRDLHLDAPVNASALPTRNVTSQKDLTPGAALTRNTSAARKLDGRSFSACAPRARRCGGASITCSGMPLKQIQAVCERFPSKRSSREDVLVDNHPVRIVEGPYQDAIDRFVPFQRQSNGYAAFGAELRAQGAPVNLRDVRELPWLRQGELHFLLQEVADRVECTTRHPLAEAAVARGLPPRLVRDLVSDPAAKAAALMERSGVFSHL